MIQSNDENIQIIKNQIINQLFSGTTTDKASPSPIKVEFDKNQYQDKVLYILEVFEEVKTGLAGNLAVGYKKNFSKGTNSNFFQKTLEYKKKFKVKYLCIIVKKKMKIRLKEVKQNELNGEFSFCKKTINLEDIKIIEMPYHNINFSITYNNKTRTWYCPNEGQKQEFIYMLAKLCEKYLKKKPKYLGFKTEELLNIIKTLKQDKQIKELKEDSEEISEKYSNEQKIQDETIQVNLEELLNDINWKASSDATALVERLNNEFTEIESNNVHAIFECEEQASLVVAQLDRAISELDVIEDWLFDYSKRLNNMGQDVKQIENKNKNLQIQTENQKKLYNELNGLLEKLYLSPDIVSLLYTEELKTEEGIKKCEEAAKKLKEKIETKFDDSLKPLTAVTERINLFHGYANHFAVRLSQNIIDIYKSESDNYLDDKSRLSKKGKLQLLGHTSLQETLIKYRPLILWLREIDPIKHNDLMMTYISIVNEVYKKEFKEYSEVLRTHHLERKTDDMEYVFDKNIEKINKLAQKVQNISANQLSLNKTGQEKKYRHFMKFGLDQSGKSISSKKQKEASALSVQTTSNISESAFEIGSDKFYPQDAISNVLNVLLPIMVQEQNFIMNIFQIRSDKKKEESNLSTSTESVSKSENLKDVSQVVTITKSSYEDVNETFDMSILTEKHEPIKDMKIKKKIFEVMEGVFDELKKELINIAEAGVQYDPTFSIGMMVRIEGFLREYKNTDQQYVYSVLETLFKHLVVLFDSYMEKQFKAIEEFKNSKKRQGVLPIINIFPNFVDCMEYNLEDNEGETRGIVTITYERTAKKIFESIDAITRDVLNDPEKYEEKEQLNIHILIIENMHHFKVELDERQIKTLEPYIRNAKAQYDQNLNSYIKIIIHRAFGKFLEFFEGIENLLLTNSSEEVGYHFKYSKASLRSVLRSYPKKEIKKGLEILYKQLSKHFTEETLIPEIWKSLQIEFSKQISKIEELIEKCYPNCNIKFDCNSEDMEVLYNDIEKSVK